MASNRNKQPKQKQPKKITDDAKPVEEAPPVAEPTVELTNAPEPPPADPATPPATLVDEQKPPGRPPGSTNKEYTPVEEIPAVCSKCQSPELVQVEGSKPVENRIAGKTRHHLPFTRVVTTRKRCKSCGQLLFVKSYFNGEPPADPATPPTE